MARPPPPSPPQPLCFRIWNHVLFSKSGVFKTRVIYLFIFLSRAPTDVTKRCVASLRLPRQASAAILWDSFGLRSGDLAKNIPFVCLEKPSICFGLCVLGNQTSCTVKRCLITPTFLLHLASISAECGALKLIRHLVTTVTSSVCASNAFRWDVCRFSSSPLAFWAITCADTWMRLQNGFNP